MFNRVLLLFSILLATFAGFFSYRASFQTSAEQLSTAYTKALTTTVHSASDTMEYDEDTGESAGTEDTRNEIVRTFFNNLQTNIGSANLQTEADDNETDATIDQKILYKYVPVIMIIDNDGYYIWHNIENDGCIDGDMTTYTSWSESISNGSTIYMIKYYLTDRVQVTVKGDNTLYDGKPADVYSQLGAAGYNTSVVSYLNDSDSFTTERNRIVAESIEENVQYYINFENEALSSDNIGDGQYRFQMPQISNGDFMEMVEHPSVIAFLQGIKIPDTKTYLNIYAFAGGEYKANGIYYASDSTGYYYSSDSDNVPDDAKNRQYSSRRKLAEDGYKPYLED